MRLNENVEKINFYYISRKQMLLGSATRATFYNSFHQEIDELKAYAIVWRRNLLSLTPKFKTLTFVSRKPLPSFSFRNGHFLEKNHSQCQSPSQIKFA